MEFSRAMLLCVLGIVAIGAVWSLNQVIVNQPPGDPITEQIKEYRQTAGILTPEADWENRIVGRYLEQDADGNLWMRVDIYPMPSPGKLAELQQQSSQPLAYDTKSWRVVWLGENEVRTGSSHSVMHAKTTDLQQVASIIAPVQIVELTSFDDTELLYFGGQANREWPEAVAVVSRETRTIGTNAREIIICKVDVAKSDWFNRLKQNVS